MVWIGTVFSSGIWFFYINLWRKQRKVVCCVLVLVLVLVCAGSSIRADVQRRVRRCMFSWMQSANLQVARSDNGGVCTDTHSIIDDIESEWTQNVQQSFSNFFLADTWTQYLSLSGPPPEFKVKSRNVGQLGPGPVRVTQLRLTSCGFMVNISSIQLNLRWLEIPT